MKRLMTILTSGFLLLTSCIVKVSTNQETTYKDSSKEFSFVQEYQVTSPVNLKISTAGGNINVIGQDNDVIEASFIVTKRGKVIEMTLDELKQIAEVEIISDKSNLEINIKKILEKNICVGFLIKTPFKTASVLTTSGGNISETSITGSQNINTSGGNLDFKNITGNVDAGTSGGNISISNSRAVFNASTSGGNIDLNNIEGNLNVSTSGGNIDANGTKPELIAVTSGGNIHLSDIQGKVDVNTSGGSIHLNSIAGSVKAYTSGGDISADIVQLTTNLELETSGGNITATIPISLGLDLDLSADQIETPLTNFSGSAQKDRIKGQMNGGGIPVNLTTSGGYLSLNYR